MVKVRTIYVVSILLSIILISLVSAGTITNTLNSPSDDSVDYDGSVTFNASVETDSGYIENYTLYLNNGSGWGVYEYKWGDYVTYDSLDDDVINQSLWTNTTPVDNNNNNPPTFTESGETITMDIDLGAIDGGDSAYARQILKSDLEFKQLNVSIGFAREGYSSNSKTGVQYIILKVGSSEFAGDITKYGTYGGTEPEYDDDSIINGNWRLDRYNQTHWAVYRNDVLIRYVEYSYGNFSVETYVFRGADLAGDAGSATATISNIQYSEDSPITFQEDFVSGDSIIWNILTCDSEGDCAFAPSNFTVTMDSTAPTISVESPTGTLDYGATSSSETLNVTITDTNLEDCWYNYNGTNVSFSCTSGVKASESFILEADNFNMTIYANDSLSNLLTEEISWGYSFFEDSSESETEVYETESQTIYLNITSTETILQMVPTLNYDGTNYTGTANCNDEGNCQIEVTIDTPLVSSGESENKTFYWILNLFDGDSSQILETNEVNQTVTRIHLEVCGGSYTTEALNFTAYDEGNLSQIDPFDFEATFDYWLGSGDVKQSTSVDNESVSDVKLCLSPTNRSLYLDGDITYGYSDDNITYVDRNYYFDSATINNVSQEIKLYLLNAGDSISFIQQVEDQTNNEVADAFIYIQRYYPEDGTFKTVQISKTDDNGKSVGFYKTETVDYKHIIIYDGEVVLETNKGKIVPESTPYTLTFKIGNAINYPWQLLEGSSVQTSLTFNDTTNILTFSWIDTTGSVQKGILIVYKQYNNVSDQLICNESAAFSSGTVTCNLTGYNGTFIAQGYLTQSSESFVKSITFVIDSAMEIFGTAGIIVGFFIILTVTLAFIWNPTAMIVMHNVSTFFVSMMGFISFSPIYLFSMIGISILLIIYLKT